MNLPEPDRERVKQLGPPDVPVFNCVVNVSPAGADGMVVARVANLAGIETRGRSEREALSQAVAAVKAVIAVQVASGQPIPWLSAPAAPAPGELQRFIALHL